MQIGVETSRAVENKRIFVVSGDDITRTVLQFMLADENETHELPDLEAAYAKAEDWKPDLMLLGLQVVEAEGTRVLREIAGRLPETRIMLIAEQGQDAMALGYLKDGAHGVLTKPFTVEAVRRRVDVMLGRADTAVVQLQVLPSAPKKGTA
jgi:DNA-binding response OmpR family regulator